MDMTELATLSLAERLRAMEVLWDSLCRDGATELSPDWHEPVLQQRREELLGQPTSSLDEVEARLRQR
ncbi:addiction module protein, partial [Piscinibacter sp.]|uniref:addiction module protein n=1 Tax=Piscinibacter sp. TaxID=1903157 RepID=UPI002F424CEF